MAYGKEILPRLENLITGLHRNEYELDLPLVNVRVMPEHAHFHMVPEVFIQTKGSSMFSFPGLSHLLKPWHILIVPPMVSHSERVIPDEAGGFENLVYVADQAEIRFHIAARGGERPVILQDSRIPGNHNALALLTQAFKDHVDRKSRFSQIGCQSVLTHLLVAYRYALLDRDETAGDAQNLLSACLRAIRINLENPLLSVKYLAGELSCSADYLSSLFSRKRGETITGYINRERVVRARILLEQTNLNSNEIAWACGYESPSYFNRVFRRQLGLTPGEFRRNGGQGLLSWETQPSVLETMVPNVISITHQA